MKIEIYSIKDAKVGVYQSPFYAQNHAVAVRTLKSAVNDDTKTNLTLYPEDFQLFHVGTFDDVTGELTSNVEFVANAVDLKNKKEN